MADETDLQLADSIGPIYEAATGDGNWLEVGERLRRLMRADEAVFRMADGDGVPHNVLAADEAAETSYAAYYHAIDPFRARARRDFATARLHHVGRVKFGSELVSDQQLLRSEYYIDFARPYGRRHMLGGMVGTKAAMPIALYRPERAEPFGTRELRLLEMMLPHFQRALELRARLGLQTERASVSLAALETLPAPIVVVDAGMKVWFANVAATALLATARSGLSLARSGPRLGAGTYLAARHRNDASELRRLVTSAVEGGAGGTMRVRNEWMDGREGGSYALIVSPLHAGRTRDIDGAGSLAGAGKGLALIVTHDLASRLAPPPDLLSELFGLSSAEAAVAAALVGGAAAEDVARRRGVSLDTVRSQIRSILAKSGAANLRDFERVMASLAATAPAPPDGNHARHEAGLSFGASHSLPAASPARKR